MYHEFRKRGTGLLARSLAEPGLLLWVLLAVVLVVLVANPLGRIILTSVQDDATGSATLKNYIGAFGSSRHLTALVNTLTMGGAVVLLAALLAVPLAWAVARTDMPGRELVRIAALAVFIMPPYLLAVGWILLAGPNAGWLNKLWISLTHASAGPLNVFSFGGLVFIMGSHLFFFIFVFTTTALELVSPEMEDAASILGAGVWRTARKVTLPLVVPAVLGGAILTFLQAIALFGVPALISIPARYPVMATQLWEFFEYPVRIGAAAAYSVPLIIMTAMLLGLQRWLLGRRGYVTVGGKGGVRRLVRLGWWRWPLCAWALLVIAVTLVLPFVVLLQAAFAKAWGKGWTLDNLTLANFRYVLFEHSAAQLGLANSVVYAASTAALTVLLAFGAAYVIERRLVPFGNALEFLCTVPVVIPGIVLAIGFYAAYAGPPFALYGSPLLLILRIHDPLFADRVCRQRERPAQHPSRHGSGGAHPGRRSRACNPAGDGAAAPAQPARRRHPGLRLRQPGAQHRNLSHRSEHPGPVRRPHQHERGRQSRSARRPRHASAGAHRRDRRGGVVIAGPRCSIHGADAWRTSFLNA